MHFILLGDLHYSMHQQADYREEFFDRLFRTVHKTGADAVIAIGDTTDNGTPEEFSGLHASAARNGVSFLTVNGNHDVLALTKSEVGQYTGNRFPFFARYFNPTSGPSDVTDPNAARFLILDTPKERNATDHGGYIGPEQMAWLANQVIESEDKPLFVFGHHPLAKATRWANFRMLCIDNSKEVWRVLEAKRQGSGFYFCGHNHANSIVRRRNWHFIQTAAPIRTADFRLIEFSPQKVWLQTLPIMGGRETVLLGQQLVRAMGDFKRFPARGFRRDREFAVSPVPSISGIREPAPTGEVECLSQPL